MQRYYKKRYEEEPEFAGGNSFQFPIFHYKIFIEFIIFQYPPPDILMALKPIHDTCVAQTGVSEG